MLLKEKIILTQDLENKNFKEEIVLTKLKKEVVYRENIISLSLYKSAVDQTIPINIICLLYTSPSPRDRG